MNSTSTADTGKPGLARRLLTRLDALLALGILVIILVFTVNNLMKRAGNPDTMSSREIRQMLKKDTERIDLFVKSIEKIPKEIATILELQKLRMQEIKIVQDSIMLNSSELFGTAVAFAPGAFAGEEASQSLYAYRKEGKVLFSVLDDPGYDYLNKDWYLLPKILDEPVWVDPYFDKDGGGVFMTTYAVPFSFFDGAAGAFTGVVTVDVSIDWLTRFFNADKKLPNNGVVMLLSEDGTVLSAPQPEWVVNHTLFSLAVTMKQPELRRVGRELQKGNSGKARVTSPDTGETVKIFYSAVPANKWGILYIIPEK